MLNPLTDCTHHCTPLYQPSATPPEADALPNAAVAAPGANRVSLWLTVGEIEHLMNLCLSAAAPPDDGSDKDALNRLSDAWRILNR